MMLWKSHTALDWGWKPDFSLRIHVQKSPRGWVWGGKSEFTLHEKSTQGKFEVEKCTFPSAILHRKIKGTQMTIPWAISHAQKRHIRSDWGWKTCFTMASHAQNSHRGFGWGWKKVSLPWSINDKKSTQGWKSLHFLAHSEFENWQALGCASKTKESCVQKWKKNGEVAEA